MKNILQGIRSQVKYTLVLPYLLLLTLVMSIGAGIAIFLIASNHQERFNNQLGQVGRNFAEALAQREQANLDFLWQIAFAPDNPEEGTPSVAGALERQDRDGLARALEAFYRIGARRDNNYNVVLDHLIVFDLDGEALIHWERGVPRSASEPPTRTEYSETDLSQLALAQQVLAGDITEDGDKFAALMTLQDIQAPEANFANREAYYFFTVAPVRSATTGELVGGLLIASRLDNLLAVLERQSQSEITAVYDDAGRILAGTVTPRSALSALGMPAGVPEQLSQQIVTAETYQECFSEPAPAFNLLRLGTSQPACSILHEKTINARDFQFLYGPMAVRNAQVGYFSVGLSRDYVTAPWTESRNAVLAITLLLAVGTVIVGYQVARQITYPLQDLVETARAVSQGQFARRSVVNAPNEFGTLAQAFNSMIQHLLQLYDMSRDLNRTIEVPQVLGVATEAANAFAPGTEALALLKEGDHWLYYVRADAPTNLLPLNRRRASQDTALFGHMATHQQIEVYAQTDAPDILPAELLTTAQYQTALVAPLVIQEQLVGLFILGHTNQTAFSESDVYILTAIANMSVTVLHNAVLYSQVKKDASERQAILTSIGDAVIVCDEQEQIVLLNRAAEEMLHLPDWQTGKYTTRMLPLERLPREASARSSPLDRYLVGDRIVSRRDAPFITEDGRTVGRVIVLHDITAETAVANITSINEAIYQALKQGLSIADIDTMGAYRRPDLPPEVLQVAPPSLEPVLSGFDALASTVRGYLGATSPVTRRNALLQANEQLEVVVQHVQSLGEPFGSLLDLVVARWRQVLTTEGGVLIRTNNSGPVANPYVAGNPVQGNLFIGREDILKRLTELWMAPGQVPSVVVYGHRRMGKSSILRNLHDRFGPQTVIVDFNMQRLGLVAGTGELLLNLALELYDNLSLAQQAALEEPDDAHFIGHNPYAVFNRFLKALDRVRGEQRFIVTVDEFELIEELIGRSRLDPGLLDFWRGLIQTYPWFIMAFAGLHTIEELRHDYWHPLFGSVTAIEVSFLAPDAARRLITQPAPDFDIDYDEDAVDEIIALTNGQPYLVQLVGHALVTRYNRQVFEEGQERARRFSRADVEAVITAPEFYRDGNAYFSGVWGQAEESAPPGQKDVLQALCRGGVRVAPRGEGMSLETVVAGSDLHQDLAQAALEALQHHDVIIERNHRYVYAVELMRRWVTQRTAVPVDDTVM